MERKTKQRDAIKMVISEAHGPVSAREVFDLAQRRVRGMGMATVYRTLKSLVEERGIVQIDMPGEPPRYEIAGKAHHHHFYCRVCGRMYEVEQCPGDLSYLAPKGFVLENHDLLLLGLCAACAAGPKARKGAKATRSSKPPASPPHDHSHPHPHNHHGHSHD